MIKSKHYALFFMTGWAIFFITAMSLNKQLDSSIPTEMVVFYRLSFALLWFTPYLFKHKKTIFKTSILKWHILRAIFTSLTIGCTYYAYRHLPLAVATSIGLSGPLFTCILAAIFLKERLTLQKIGMILIGYFGVLLVVSKDFLPWIIGVFKSIFLEKTALNTLFNPSLFAFEETILIALLGNLLMGFVLILLKHVTKTDSPPTVLFYNTLLTTFLCGGYAITNLHIPSDHNLYYLIMIGALGLVLQFCYTKAMSIEDASFVSPLEYLRILIAIPVGIFFFQEEITLQILAGILLILGSTYWITKDGKF